jgi:hypothetical protein
MYRYLCDVRSCLQNKRGTCTLAKEAEKKYTFYCPWLRKIRVL